MAIEQMTMPQLGESVTEGTISKWLVSVGDHVNKYDPIAEVMTDKVNAEVPSSFTGTITELVGKKAKLCKSETSSAKSKQMKKRNRRLRLFPSQIKRKRSRPNRRRKIHLRKNVIPRRC
jgi:2-oxoisovalerate dehydrogenase E2 component (dihydrolipoyl transacylase)